MWIGIKNNYKLLAYIIYNYIDMYSYSDMIDFRLLRLNSLHIHLGFAVYTY